MSAEQAFIVYDGDCPFCARYVKLVRLRDAVGPVTLVNARDSHPVVDFVKSRGVSLNEEMALVIGEQVFAGADCMHRLALMSTPSGAFNRVNARVFASPRTARLLYPILRVCRNATLRVLARRPID